MISDFWAKKYKISKWRVSMEKSYSNSFSQYTVTDKQFGGLFFTDTEFWVLFFLITSF